MSKEQRTPGQRLSSWLFSRFGLTAPLPKGVAHEPEHHFAHTDNWGQELNLYAALQGGFPEMQFVISQEDRLKGKDGTLHPIVEEYVNENTAFAHFWTGLTTNSERLAANIQYGLETVPPESRFRLGVFSYGTQVLRHLDVSRVDFLDIYSPYTALDALRIGNQSREKLTWLRNRTGRPESTEQFLSSITDRLQQLEDRVRLHLGKRDPFIDDDFVRKAFEKRLPWVEIILYDRQHVPSQEELAHLFSSENR